jgi:hypothetical protein
MSLIAVAMAAGFTGCESVHEQEEKSAYENWRREQRSDRRQHQAPPLVTYQPAVQPAAEYKWFREGEMPSSSIAGLRWMLVNPQPPVTVCCGQPAPLYYALVPVGCCEGGVATPLNHRPVPPPVSQPVPQPTSYNSSRDYPQGVVVVEVDVDVAEGGIYKEDGRNGGSAPVSNGWSVNSDGRNARVVTGYDGYGNPTFGGSQSVTGGHRGRHVVTRGVSGGHGGGGNTFETRGAGGNRIYW